MAIPPFSHWNMWSRVYLCCSDLEWCLSLPHPGVVRARWNDITRCFQALRNSQPTTVSFFISRILCLSTRQESTKKTVTILEMSLPHLYQVTSIHLTVLLPQHLVSSATYTPESCFIGCLWNWMKGDMTGCLSQTFLFCFVNFWDLKALSGFLFLFFFFSSPFSVAAVWKEKKNILSLCFLLGNNMLLTHEIRQRFQNYGFSRTLSLSSLPAQFSACVGSQTPSLCLVLSILFETGVEILRYYQAKDFQRRRHEKPLSLVKK